MYAEALHVALPFFYYLDTPNLLRITATIIIADSRGTLGEMDQKFLNFKKLIFFLLT